MVFTLLRLNKYCIIQKEKIEYCIKLRKEFYSSVHNMYYRVSGKKSNKVTTAITEQLIMTWHNKLQVSFHVG